jgi:uncharacterized protein (DUF58 family)
VSDVREILRQVRRIEIVANRAVNDLFAGEYHSVFRGRGMEFDEVREYQPGDEIRTIDWNVTARAGAPFVKRFREERELTVMFLVDVSASTAFGSGSEPRLTSIAKCAAMLMFSALKNQDKVGLATFADHVRDYFVPRKGKGAVLRLLRELLDPPPPSSHTNVAAALEFLNKVQKRRSVAFLFSDWLDPQLSTPAFQKTLAATAKRHDLIAVMLRDERERRFEAAGIATFEDLETGVRVELDTSSPKVRAWLEQKFRADEERIVSLLRRSGVDLLAVPLPRDPDARPNSRSGASGRDAVLDAFGKRLLELFRRRERRR